MNARSAEKQRERKYAKFGLRTLLFCVLLVAVFFAGWAYHRRSLRMKLRILHWTHDAATELNEDLRKLALEEEQASDPQTRKHLRLERARKEQLLGEVLSKSKQTLQDLPETD